MAGVAAALVVLTACGQPAAEERTQMDPSEELQSRPGVEHLEERYLAAMGELQIRLGERVPGLDFDGEPRRAGTAGCARPFDNLGGESRTYLGGTSVADFDHARWSEVETVADEVMERHGFTKDKVVVVDKADYHKVSWFDEYDSDFTLGADVRVVASVIGACARP